MNFNLNHLTRIIRSFSKDNHGKRFSDCNCEATVVATEGLNKNDIPSKLPGYPHLSSEVLLREVGFLTAHHLHVCLSSFAKKGLTMFIP